MGITTWMNHIVMREPGCQGSLLERKKSNQDEWIMFARLVMSDRELEPQKGLNGLNYQAPRSFKEQWIN